MSRALRRPSKRISLPSQDKIVEFCRRNHIRKLALFGSILRPDFSPESDVDVLVEFELGKTPGFIALMQMQEELSSMFGRRVDLRTPEDLSRYFRDEVVMKAKVQYVAD